MRSPDRYAADSARRRCPLCKARAGARHEDGWPCAPGYWWDDPRERLRVLEVMARQGDPPASG